MPRLAFEGFELDPTSGELWKKGGECLQIPEQPLNLLLCLLEQPGQVVGREVLQKRVWAGDVHVGYEDGLNSAAWRLRQLLGDTAEQHRYIETIPRKGYRFVGKAMPLSGTAPPPSDALSIPISQPDSGKVPRAGSSDRRVHQRSNRWLIGWVLLGLSVGGFGLWAASQPRPVTLGIVPLHNATGDPAMDYFAEALTWQVTQDLSEIRALKGVSLPNRPRPWGEGRAPLPGTLACRLDWTLSRVDKGYRISVEMTGAGGEPRGSEVFVAAQEDVHAVHRKIATFIVARTPLGSKQATGATEQPQAPRQP